MKSYNDESNKRQKRPCGKRLPLPLPLPLGNRYKDEFLSTKAKLEETKVSLVDTEKRESKLIVESRMWKEEAECLENEHENPKSKLEETQGNLVDTEERESKLIVEVGQWTDRAERFNTDLIGTKELLRKRRPL